MKALKIYTGTLMLLSLIVITACNDSITSSLNPESKENQISVSENSKRGDFYSGSFILNPGESLFLDQILTSLQYITEYSISNCGISKKDIHITASNVDGSMSLPCSSTDYFLYDLTIENRSGQIRTIDVKLVGISEK